MAYLSVRRRSINSPQSCDKIVHQSANICWITDIWSVNLVVSSRSRHPFQSSCAGSLLDCAPCTEPQSCLSNVQSCASLPQSVPDPAVMMTTGGHRAGSHMNIWVSIIYAVILIFYYLAYLIIIFYVKLYYKYNKNALMRPKDISAPAGILWFSVVC